MTTHSYRTPEQQASWNRWHWIVALLLALVLVILWLMGRGPGFVAAGGSCCSAATPAVATQAPQVEATPALPDADGDGVPDASDECPETPQGDRVGPRGCSCDVTIRLQFQIDSDQLTAEDVTVLDDALRRLEGLKFIEGVVEGHTDNTADAAYNQQLSERRARTVMDYLSSHGIAPDRMTAVGYGETRPIADNATEEGRAQNRRVVVRRSDCPAP